LLYENLNKAKKLTEFSDKSREAELEKKAELFKPISCKKASIGKRNLYGFKFEGKIILKA
jgi:hypothetical protein